MNIQKIKIISITILGFLIVSSCSNSSNQEYKVQNLDTLDTIKKPSVKLVQKKMLLSVRDSILSYNIVRSKDKGCKDWQIPSKTDLPRIFESFYEITGNEWHNCYGDRSCYVEGKIFYNNKEYNYYLDAGGWMILSNKKEQLYFGCKSPDCKKHFPNDCFCNEKGLIDELD